MSRVPSTRFKSASPSHPKRTNGLKRSSGRNGRSKIPEVELKSNIMNNTPISGLPSILDSFIRGLGRYLETLMEDYWLRLPFRFGSEVVRYGGTRALQSYMKNEKIAKDLWIIGLKKSLEITAGTALVDPNRESDYFKRIGKGFLNMGARALSRGVFILFNILNKKQLNLRTMPDEFLSRTLCRVIYIDTENPALAIGCRTLEQFAINEWIRHLPFNNWIVPAFNGSNGQKNRVRKRQAA